MRSKPPHGQGRDRQDRNRQGGHRPDSNRQDHKGAGGRHGGKGPNRGPKSHGSQERGGKFRGDRHEQPQAEAPRRDFQRKESGPKDFKHSYGKSAALKNEGFTKKEGAKQHHESRPRPERAAPEPKPQSRIDHGGGAVDVWLYGHHAVTAALANQERRILRLLATPEALERLRGEDSVPKDALNRARSASRKEIDNIVGENAVHQGVAMLTRAIEHHLEDILEIAKENETCCVVLLDQVSDPHNVGAILRSAAAFNAAAVITLDRRAAAETGAMAKSASGALDRIAFVQTTNLARAIEVLKQNQFWVVGLEADGEKKIAEVDLKGRIAFVMGTEGEGLRRLVRESCDQIVRLPINASSESLNVSNAAAIALYERSRQLGS